MAETQKTREMIERSASVEESHGTITHRFALTVPENLEYFDGHFDGVPMLAAVVQLDVLIMPRIERVFGDLGRLERARRLKFHAPIRPNEDLTLLLSRRQGTTSVAFTIERGSVVCSSGTLMFIARDLPR